MAAGLQLPPVQFLRIKNTGTGKATGLFWWRLLWRLLWRLWWRPFRGRSPREMGPQPGLRALDHPPSCPASMISTILTRSSTAANSTIRRPLRRPTSIRTLVSR